MALCDMSNPLILAKNSLHRGAMSSTPRGVSVSIQATACFDDFARQPRRAGNYGDFSCEIAHLLLLSVNTGLVE